jgi:hypothetical protein
MIEIKCDEYFNEVKKMAKRLGKLEQFESQLEYLNSYANHDDSENTKCIIFKDFAPLSFEFLMMKKQEDGSYKNWFNGGLIFHGQVDNFGSGSFPTLSVCVDPTDGWSIHT